MTRTGKTLFAVFLTLNLILASCAPKPVSDDVTPDPATETSAPLPTSIPTDSSTEPSPTPEPEVIANVNGVVIYDDMQNIVSINMDTGETKVLISRDELELLLKKEDKSAESYTYGYDKPMTVVLSPDFTKALVSICATLDSRFRCVFEDFVYSLQDKIAVRLEFPPDTYGIYWKWSPDGTKLAGAAWTYEEAFYKINRFYSINSDGTELKAIAPVTNGHWRLAWHPGSRVVLPLTFVTNFRSVFADGSSDDLDVPIEGLEWNDRLECIAFSPDTEKVAFVIRRELTKDHDWLYTARSDFAELTAVTEYDIDARYTCDIAWSPDQNFVHVKYEYGLGPETGQVDKDRDFPPRDKVLDLRTNTSVDLPSNSRACGWAPNGDLIYEKIDITGEETGIEILGLSNSTPLTLSDEVKSSIKHCPIQWLKEDLAFEVPVGLTVPNACTPGMVTQDEVDEEPIPVLFDMVESSSSLNGNVLTAVMTFTSVSKDLAPYVTPDITDFFNGWEVLVDVDNNALTGDRLGIEYRMSIVVRPGTPPVLGNALLRYNAAQGTYERAEPIQVTMNPTTNTITLTGTIPEITENSRLVFLSRLVDKMVGGAPNVISDRICN